MISFDIDPLIAAAVVAAAAGRRRARRPRQLSDWTLGAVKAWDMEIVALCEAEGCRHLFAFDLDALIDGVGPDYKLDDIPPLDCPRCGAGPLLLRLSFADPPPAEGK